MAHGDMLSFSNLARHEKRKMSGKHLEDACQLRERLKDEAHWRIAINKAAAFSDPMMSCV